MLVWRSLARHDLALFQTIDIPDIHAGENSNSTILDQMTTVGAGVTRKTLNEALPL